MVLSNAHSTIVRVSSTGVPLDEEPLVAVPLNADKSSVEDKSCPDCDICGRPGLAVVASYLGAYSYSLCKECLVSGREPYHSWVSYVFCIGGYDELDDEYKDFLLEDLKYYGKTLEEFHLDVGRCIDEYLDSLS